ncbi:hypothetical protein [Enterococcus malodoratus]|uniref:hypothetical protein n=1 Tax=Enterococcus malodoratus TaxID=71451 RepID=UPI0003AB0D27|nr:hypothetical protein [Enterococcus malodoratus]OJG62535.1 hypothetical protein RV07_GL001306 [Enterococcus malodoratus]
MSADGSVTDVKVTTELKLSVNDVSKPSSEFFTNFNGNDTKIYAYLNGTGNIVLAFTPIGHSGPYTSVGCSKGMFKLDTDNNK